MPADPTLRRPPPSCRLPTVDGTYYDVVLIDSFVTAARAIINHRYQFPLSYVLSNWQDLPATALGDRRWSNSTACRRVGAEEDSPRVLIHPPPTLDRRHRCPDLSYVQRALIDVDLTGTTFVFVPLEGLGLAVFFGHSHGRSVITLFSEQKVGGVTEESFCEVFATSRQPEDDSRQLSSVRWIVRMHSITSIYKRPRVLRSALLPKMVVSAETFRTVVGIIGNGTALVLFLSPAPTFHRIWRSGSVEQFHATPYLATLLNCLFWILYGLPMVHPHSTLILTINGSGLVIELVYVLIFLRCCDRARKLRVFSVLVAEILLVGAVAAVDLTLVHGYQRRSLIVGVLCVVFGTVMYAAPLSVMQQVIKTKSVEFMPLSLSLASFLNGVCWTTYALIRFDLFITIPNGLGVAFAVAQLVLHVMYHASTKQQIKERKMKIEMGEAKWKPQRGPGSREQKWKLESSTNENH
ncbi:sugar transmembrane transporter [Musa troglodytarum]|uniref:Sugar transmembrane transporter n=1 Tax=Musa troglodytarum TaxID=320322 RepID=A0A9E7HPJ9_9LILI|nr:sugar transmembrane transporter [Musa troglodytarum]